MTLLRFFDRLFFTPVSAQGFGLMRIAWAGTTGLFFLFQLPDVPAFYGPDGLLPARLSPALFGPVQFSLLAHAPSLEATWALYVLLLLSLLCTAVGLLPRMSLALALFLTLSFHAYNPLLLAGGDTMIRLIGWMLLVSPRIDAFSLSRLRQQWRAWRADGQFLPPPLQPSWPSRLLLWQFIVIYVTSVWYKLLGTLWLRGTATGIALQHPVFSRLPQPLIRTLLLPFSPVVNYLSLLWEGLWGMLLLPASVRRRWILPLREPHFRRFLLLCGVLFHGGILLLLDAGSFSLVMIGGYLGLLRAEDFSTLRTVLNKKFIHKYGSNARILVLYDGHCGLCRRSMFALLLPDHLHRLRPVDFRNDRERDAVAPPHLSLEELDRALHIAFPNGRTLHGFSAFRELTRHLPLLLPLRPLLFLPGALPLGNRLYARIAARRKRCSHERCMI